MPRSVGWREERPAGGARGAAPGEDIMEVGQHGAPAPVSEVLTELLARREFAAGVRVGLLARRWGAVVGDRLAAETAPARLDAGVLTVHATTGPWGAQARFLAEEIRKRANEALGTAEIKRVQVVVRPE